MNKKPELEISAMVDEIIDELAEVQAEKPALVALSKATTQVSDVAKCHSLQALEEHELKSIYALCAWVANEQDAAQETVQCITEARFGVNHITRLQQKDYDEVIKFLVDLRIDEMKN